MTASDRARTVLVVTGLRREAKLASGDGRLVVTGGGRSDLLRARLREIDPESLRAVISFGVAGALDPALAVGDVVLATSVSGGSRRVATDKALAPRWAQELGRTAVAYRQARLVGVDAPVLDAAAKSRLHAESGAAAVDMESHVAAEYAAARGLPFGVLRVVSDSASHTLPPVAGRAMRPDGSVDVLAVMAGLARDPAQLAPLLATARDAGRAFRILGRVRGLLSLDGSLLGLDL